MLSVWQGQSLTDFHSRLSCATGAEHRPFRYSENVSMVEQSLRQSKLLSNCILLMLSLDRKASPTAAEIAKTILILPPWFEFVCQCIGSRVSK